MNSNPTKSNEPLPLLRLKAALDAGIIGVQSLVEAPELKEVVLPEAVIIPISTVTAYLKMLLAQPEISVEKDAYMTGVNHGALIAIWRYLQVLGYVADADFEKTPVEPKKGKN